MKRKRMKEEDENDDVSFMYQCNPTPSVQEKTHQITFHAFHGWRY